MFTQRIAAIVVPLVVVLTVCGGWFSTRALRASDQDAVGTWSAFSATVRTTVPGSPDTLGRFHRASDGSTRFEATAAGETQVIINNFTQQAHYRLLVTPGRPEVWTRQPLWVPANGWHPPTHERLREPAGGGDEVLDGFRVLRLTGPDGAMRLVALDLDYFPIVEEVPGGRRTAYSKIMRGDPGRALFEPPPGAVVKVLDTPVGGPRLLPGVDRSKAPRTPEAAK